MTSIKCCKDCTQRYIGCHSDCERYNKEKSDNDKYKAIVQSHKDKINRDRAYVRDALEKNRRSHR